MSKSTEIILVKSEIDEELSSSSDYSISKTTVTTKKDYNNLLDAIDIIRVKKIIEHVGKLQHNYIDSIELSSFFKLANPKKLNPIYRDTSDDGIKRSECIVQYTAISDYIDTMSVRAGSIKNSFTNFPWEDLQKVSYLLKESVKVKDFTKYDVYKFECDKSLKELVARLEYIVQVSEIRNPEIRKILQENDLVSDGTVEDYAQVTKQYQMLQDIGYSDLRFIHSEDKAPRGLFDIRKITEPTLDSERQAKILEFIKLCENFDATTSEGRFALCSTIFMIGEVVKSISDQTKQKNQNIPFKELKDFRNKLHDLDVMAKSKKFLNCVERMKIYFRLLRYF